MRPNELGEMFGNNPPDRASWADVDDPRGNRGTMVPLYTRMMRAFQGDPVGYGVLTSTGTGNVLLLPDNNDVRSVVAYVSGNDILYRVDGLPPTPTGDQKIQTGSTFTLTGMPTIKGFQFCSAVAGNATIFFTYYN